MNVLTIFTLSNLSMFILIASLCSGCAHPPNPPEYRHIVQWGFQESPLSGTEVEVVVRNTGTIELYFKATNELNIVATIQTNRFTSISNSPTAELNGYTAALSSDGKVFIGVMDDSQARKQNIENIYGYVWSPEGRLTVGQFDYRWISSNSVSMLLWPEYFRNNEAKSRAQPAL